jgi:UDP-N-acetylmuramoyl-L-alanyl-D-glutamate--2,6-diaminopimelate ligase
VALPDAVRVVPQLTPVPGRLQRVNGAGIEVVVDYAHTPDALEKALRALQPLSRQRGGAVWVLAGCGGDRDPGKRPLMASVAEREAQHVVLTSDNPRSENPTAILDQMRGGLQRPAQARVEIDRAAAIADTVARAAASDVVLIAGKGHEDYQEVMGVKTPFSDLAHARAALDRRLSGRTA